MHCPKNAYFSRFARLEPHKNTVQDANLVSREYVCWTVFSFEMRVQSLNLEFMAQVVEPSFGFPNVCVRKLNRVFGTVM